MKSALLKYLESTSKAKLITSASFILLGMILATFSNIFVADFPAWRIIVSVTSLLLGVGCILHHIKRWCGVGLPFPLTKNTINGKWEHFMGYEYTLGLTLVNLSSFLAYPIWYVYLPLFFGFTLGMRRGWNFNNMDTKICNCWK